MNEIKTLFDGVFVDNSNPDKPVLTPVGRKMVTAVGIALIPFLWRQFITWITNLFN